MKRPIFKKKEEWKELIADWQSSGVSARKWCQEKKIPRSTFHQWKNKLLPVVKKTARNSFVDLPEEKRWVH